MGINICNKVINIRCHYLIMKFGKQIVKITIMILYTRTYLNEMLFSNNLRFRVFLGI